MSDVVRGAELLREVMAVRRMPQSEVGEILGVSQVAVSVWLTGKARPDAQARDAIELAFAIPREAWRTEEESRALLALADPPQPCTCGRLVAKTGTEA